MPKVNKENLRELVIIATGDDTWNVAIRLEDEAGTTCLMGKVKVLSLEEYHEKLPRLRNPVLTSKHVLRSW